MPNWTRVHGIAAPDHSVLISGPLPKKHRQIRIKLIDKGVTFFRRDLAQAVGEFPQRLIARVFVGIRPLVFDRLRRQERDAGASGFEDLSDLRLTSNIGPEDVLTKRL